MNESLGIEELQKELDRSYREIAEKDLVIERQQSMVNQMFAAIGRQTWNEMLDSIKKIGGAKDD